MVFYIYFRRPLPKAFVALAGGAIAGILCGSLVIAIVVGLLIYCCYRKCARQLQSSKHLKAGHHRPPAKCLLNGVSLVGRWLPDIASWLGVTLVFKQSLKRPRYGIPK